MCIRDSYRRLWEFFTNMGAGPDRFGWLTDAVKARYREVWDQGLRGGCNYYRASPLRPPTAQDAAASQIELPLSMLTITLPTLVVWALDDIALPPELIDGLDAYIPKLTLMPVSHATHWIVHEDPGLVIGALQAFLT